MSRMFGKTIEAISRREKNNNNSVQTLIGYSLGILSANSSLLLSNSIDANQQKSIFAITCLIKPMIHMYVYVIQKHIHIHYIYTYICIYSIYDIYI